MVEWQLMYQMFIAFAMHNMHHNHQQWTVTYEELLSTEMYPGAAWLMPLPWQTWLGSDILPQ